MYQKTYTGYNCFSSAIEQYTGGKENQVVSDIIETQWSFEFDKKLFWNNGWYAAASLTPVDHLLVKDLKEYAGIEIKENIATKEQAIEESRRMAMQNKMQILLTDFYYLNSVNWKAMSRFQVYPQHDSHFILVTGVNDNEVEYIDPYYSYKGKLSWDNFMKCREHETKQAFVNYQSYELSSKGKMKYDIQRLIQKRFERFMEKKMYWSMEELSCEVYKRGVILGHEENMEWILDGYNSLRSIVEQRENLAKVQDKYQISLPDGLEELGNLWAKIRRLMFESYKNKIVDTQRLSYEIYETYLKERKFAKRVTEYLS